ncbi:MAG TPA: DUF3568 family protein [Gemmataceae bacterium]|jgi:hypothetical protein|nr:DUF3568 family protein [Gemmataceae bacterium]
MGDTGHGRVRRLAYLGLAALLLVNAGCLVVAAGAAVGGAAAAGYAYYNGCLYRDYPASLGDSLAAVRTALVELQFPILKEETDTGTAVVLTRTADGSKVRIHLDVVPSRIPVEASATRVSVRVGALGDEAVSVRLLDQVSAHLVPGAGAPRLTPQPAAPALGPIQTTAETRPGETVPPPLAPSEPVGARK